MSGPPTSDPEAPSGPEDRTLGFGRYQLLERLGEGGMAEVFKAKSFGVEGFEKVLVIKRILPELAKQPRFVDLFVHEAKLAVRLSHANIVQVFDLGRVDHGDREAPSYFIAMEYVAGLDLATLLARCRKRNNLVPFGMAVFLTAEVAKALDHAHRRRDEQGRPLGIVHRDISPQNILLSWEGEVKVTDFGIAKARDSLFEEDVVISRPGRVHGKLSYTSPEQAEGRPLDSRSDLFSLGTVLYEMLAGNNPFAAPTTRETARRVAAGEYPPLELLRPDTPIALVEIVDRLLRKDVSARFSDAGKVHEHLLGYFYASGERFGSNKLSEFLEPFHSDRPVSEFAGALFDNEIIGEIGRTPVEVVPLETEARGRSDSPEAGSPQAAATVGETGERREVTALALSLMVDRGLEGRPAAVERRAREVLARYGAIIVEEEAAQLVAIFGLVDADGRDTHTAIHAALKILRVRSDGVSVSAGVHVAGILVDGAGAPQRDERFYSLIACAQTLARATDGQITASRLAARIVRAEFVTDDAPKSNSVPEGGRIITSAHPPSALYRRFIGRRHELRGLGDILAAATQRRVQLVTIQGDKGIGKTRMVAEMSRRLAKGNYNVGFYVATCPKNGSAVPNSSLKAMLHVLCGVQEGDDESRIRDVLPRLRALGLSSDESSAVLAELGVTCANGPRRPPEDTAAPLGTAFSRMVQSLSDDRLHVFVFDDAQSIDAATIETITRVATRGHMRRESITPPSSASGALRAVFVFASCEEPVEALARHPNHHLVALGELAEDDAARLIANRINAPVLPPELVEFCRDRAGGHPLFLEELVRELLDSSAVSTEGGVVTVHLDAATTIPRTLRTLIAGRVSRLNRDERAALQAAAVLGEPIRTDTLAVLLGASIAHTTRVVSGLFARDFLRITGPHQVSFPSPIHADIALDAVPSQSRRALHAAAAAALVATSDEDVAEHDDRIGEQFLAAGEGDRSSTYFARAALQKLRLGHLEPGIRLLVRALDLADVDQRSAAEVGGLLGALASGVSRVRPSSELPRVTARALARVDCAGTVAEKVLARVSVARALCSLNLFDDAYRHLDEGLALAGDDKELSTAALIVEIEMAFGSGDYARALRATETLEGLGPLDTPRELLAVSLVRAATGDAAAALAAIEAAETKMPAGDRSTAVDLERQRVLVHLHARDGAAAVEASLRAIELSRAAGLPFGTGHLLHDLGRAYLRGGDLARAYAALSASKEAAEATFDGRLLARNRIHLAYLDGLGGFPGTDELIRDLVGYAEDLGYLRDAREGRFLRGALLAHQGKGEAARREFEVVLRLASAHADRSLTDDATEALAKL